MNRSGGRGFLLLPSALFAIAWASLPAASADVPPFPTAPHPFPYSMTGGPISLRTPGPPEILFPRSTFTMGSSMAEIRIALDACEREPLGSECKPEMFEDELAEHPVFLSPYWLDRTEVTVREFMRCVEAGACDAPPFHRGAERFQDPTYPVSLVSWDGARAYCAFVGKQLPTEAQWERAARGLSRRRFPWGNHFASRRANHGAWALDPTDGSDGFLELAPVGSFPQGRTPEELDDMAGNVAEWVLDNYEDAYKEDPVADPTGPAFGTHKVVRGGAFNTGMAWLRGAARMHWKASTRAPHLGFRCARNASPHRHATP